MYIDVHCHLNDGAFEGDLTAVLQEMRQNGVGFALCAGCDLESSYLARDIAEKYEEVYFCAGFQPQEADKFQEGDLEKLRALVRHEKCLAIGEVGLDYHYPDNPEKSWQKEVFLRQARLACEEGLPLVIHSRDCAEDMQNFLTERKDLLTNGFLLHCYSHSAEQSEAFSALGGYFSFGGTATFNNSRKVVKSVQRVPFDRILSETDSPYLTPEPLRGTFPNTPKNIPFIMQKLAELRGVSELQMKERVLKNAKTLFKKWR